MHQNSKGRVYSIVLMAILISSHVSVSIAVCQSELKTLSEIWIRDPNIVFYEGKYYMTGTTADDGFLGFSSSDLVNWESHGYIYRKNDSNSWAKRLFWAAEIVPYNGKFYLFFTADKEGGIRGTGVAVSDSAMGPYVDLIPEPLTPKEFHCLDGHVFKHPNGSLYFYYVFEWINNGTGEMWVQEIAPDFKSLLGTPKSLFKGGDAKWSNGVVDGPSMLFVNNTYYLFWSSFNKETNGHYCAGYASASDPWGPFTQSNRPVIWDDCGHSTWFIENSTGKLKITFHKPNGPIGSGNERAVIKDLLFDSKLRTWYVYPPESAYPENAWLGPVMMVSLVVVVLGISVIIIRKLKKTKHIS